MEVSDIIALSKAGFSASQIAEMIKQEKPQEQKPQEQEQKQEQKPQEQKPQEQKPQEQKPQEMTFEKIYEEINKLRRTVEESNIKNSNQPENQSVDDILSKFINDNDKE